MSLQEMPQLMCLLVIFPLDFQKADVIVDDVRPAFLEYL